MLFSFDHFVLLFHLIVLKLKVKVSLWVTGGQTHSWRSFDIPDSFVMVSYGSIFSVARLCSYTGLILFSDIGWRWDQIFFYARRVSKPLNQSNKRTVFFNQIVQKERTKVSLYWYEKISYSFYRCAIFESRRREPGIWFNLYSDLSCLQRLARYKV